MNVLVRLIFGVLLAMVLGKYAAATNLLVLDDGFPDSSKSLITTIVETAFSNGISTNTLSMDSLAENLGNAQGKGNILLLTNSIHFPVNAKAPLERFLKRGNHLIALSGLPFLDMDAKIDGKWMNQNEIKEALAEQEGQEIIDLSKTDLNFWIRSSKTMKNQTTFQVENTELPGGLKALHLQLNRLDDWDTLASPNLEEPFAEDNTVTTFWAKGGTLTPELIFEWVEKDGSRWMGIVKLTSKWKRYALTPSDFTFWQDKSPKNRGGEQDEFNPLNASHFTVGLAQGMSSQTMGIAHEYWIAGIQSTRDFAERIDFSQPLIESISPAYKMHQTPIAKMFVPESGETVYLSANITSPIQRELGLTSESLHGARLIPLVEGLDAGGKRRGSVAHMYINNTGDYAGSVFVYVGLSQKDLEQTAPLAAPMIIQIVNTITKGVFLANGGSDYFAYTAGESVTPGAFVVNNGEGSAKVTLQFEISANGKIVYSTSETVNTIPHNRPVKVTANKITLKEGEYSISTTLLLEGLKIDSITHPFTVIKTKKLASRNVVSVRGEDFYLNGKKWYGIGVNYWPRYSAGQEATAYSLNWLHPEQYDPVLIEEDLRLAEKLGVNLFSIQYFSLIQARPLMDFLERAKRHGILVHIFIPGLDPVRQDFELANRLILAANLSESPAIFAYDVGWEVHLGHYDVRRLFDGEWQEWVIDQYGSIENAENDWKYTPQQIQGIITGPTDQQIITDGDWRIFVAAYRRFWDNKFSEGYRRTRENIKTLDPKHLIGVRSGYGGQGSIWAAPVFPIDLLSGVKHLDFVSPEGYNIGGSWREFLKGGFDNAYCRFVSRGKPVFWAEYGNPLFVGLPLDAYRPWTGSEKLVDEADYYRNFLQMILQTGANASAAWWWPGGYRVDERSDFGIVNPNGTPRAAAMEIFSASEAHKSLRKPKRTDGFITIDRDKYVSGYAGVCEEHAQKWADLFLEGKNRELRTEGTGTTSANTPLIAVGNVPYNGNNPLKYLDSELNYIKINGMPVSSKGSIEVAKGKPVYIELGAGNIGEAKWLSTKNSESLQGQVVVLVKGLERTIEIPIRDDTEYLKDTSISKTLISNGIQSDTELTIRMAAKGRAGFGQIYKVLLRVK